MMINATNTIQLFTRQQARMQSMSTSDPIVKREIQYFQDTISKIKTAKDFIGNYRLFTFATKAFGLQEMGYAKAFFQKLMESGLANEDALANKLSDKRFKAFVQTFNFGDLGGTTTLISTKMQNVVDLYKRQTLEDKAGEMNSAAKIALYFERKAPEIKNGMFFIADKALFKFVQTAYNIPSLTSTTETAIDNAAALIERKINFENLTKPAEVHKMMTRFAALWDLQNTDSSGSLVSTLGNNPGSGMSNALLQSIQAKYTSS